MTFHCNDCGLDFSETEPANNAEAQGTCPRCQSEDLGTALTGMPPHTKGPLTPDPEPEPEPIPEHPDVPPDKVPPTEPPSGSKPVPQKPRRPDPPGKVG